MGNAHRKSPLGRSFLLVDADVAIDDDLRMIADEDNLHQAFRVAVETQLGSNPIHKDLGFDVLGIFAKPGTVSRVRDLLRLNLVRMLSRDPRVKRIVDIVFEGEPRFVELVRSTAPEASANPRSSRRWRVVAVVETIQGEVSLDLTVGPESP